MTTHRTPVQRDGNAHWPHFPRRSADVFGRQLSRHDFRQEEAPRAENIGLALALVFAAIVMATCP